MQIVRPATAASLLVSTLLSACGGGDGSGIVVNPPTPALPQLSEAKSSTLRTCEALAAQFSFDKTKLDSSTLVNSGVLKVAGKDIGEHCLVSGNMHQRAGANGNYAIGFEMRMPKNWNGRFFYQANGGSDGNVNTAMGDSGGGPLNNALNMGFAVISSDAGHNGAQNAAGVNNFGVDPQARLDYGYQAVGKLTPMAKSLITAAYGRAADRSYIGGCSNGGRHTMVAASRYAADYDGFLVGNAGFNLPLAATANIAGYQKYQSLASKPGDAGSGFTQAERATVVKAVLGKCDALDGAVDGMVQNTAACKTAFDLQRDVATCSSASARDGSCLTAEQKTGIGELFSGAKTASGKKIYASWPYDNGMQTGGWSFWKFVVPGILDSVAVGQIWMTPPQNAASFNPVQFAATGNLDQILTGVNATSSTYTESAMSFMTPPNPSNLSTLKGRGAKMMVYHGTADPIFSSDDTANWYDSLSKANSGDASNFARYYQVPGMNHCSGGPSTDQFDMLSPLVDWVEKGKAPAEIVATARGNGNAGGVNTDLPSDWAADRSRPLCAYPKVARYKGSGSMEVAANFSCQ